MPGLAQVKQVTIKNATNVTSECVDSVYERYKWQAVLITYINTPDCTAVKQEWSCLADFPDVRYIPNVQAVIIVNTCHFIVHTTVADCNGVGISTVLRPSSNSSDITKQLNWPPTDKCHMSAIRILTLTVSKVSVFHWE